MDPIKNPFSPGAGTPPYDESCCGKYRVRWGKRLSFFIFTLKTNLMVCVIDASGVGSSTGAFVGVMGVCSALRHRAVVLLRVADAGKTPVDVLPDGLVERVRLFRRSSGRYIFEKAQKCPQSALFPAACGHRLFLG